MNLTITGEIRIRVFELQAVSVVLRMVLQCAVAGIADVRCGLRCMGNLIQNSVRSRYLYG